MDQVKISVLQLELSERFAERTFRVFVLSVPQLGHNEEIFSANYSFIYASLYSLAHILFILV